MIYFDHNATTTLDAGVREAMLPFLDGIFGNPSSIHQAGRRARACLDGARESVAAVWRCKPSEVVFTSGGSEACNLAVLGAARGLAFKGRHLVTSPIEHPAVLAAMRHLQDHEGFTVSWIPVDSAGSVTVDRVLECVRSDTVLVSVMAANNEIGTRQPVEEIGAACRSRGICFHTDAVQWFGKEPFDSIHQFNADLVSACAHKYHGPKGAGALFIRSPLQPLPLQFGGSQEHERRPGTENLAAIAGFAAATSRFVRDPVFPRALLTEWTEMLACAMAKLPGVQVLAGRSPRLVNTLAMTVEGCDSLGLLASLDLEGVCASSGSACSSGSLEPSHVLLAMGLSVANASSLVRFSLGRDNTAAEVRSVAAMLPRLIERVRAARAG